MTRRGTVATVLVVYEKSSYPNGFPALAASTERPFGRPFDDPFDTVGTGGACPEDREARAAGVPARVGVRV